jgi:hypothetical protein
VKLSKEDPSPGFLDTERPFSKTKLMFESSVISGLDKQK